MTPLEMLRRQVVDFLHWELIGPGKPDEVLDEPPTLRYSAGVLFPGGVELTETADAGEDAGQKPAFENTDAVEEDAKKSTGGKRKGKEPAADNESVHDEKRKGYGPEDSPDVLLDTPVQLAHSLMPSAMGLSFVCERGVRLRLSVRAGTYKKAGKADHDARNNWQRSPVEQNWEFEVSRLEKPKREKLNEGLGVYLMIRERDDDLCLVTIAVWNCRKREGAKRADSADCFFQVGFRVESCDGKKHIHEYRQSSPISNDDEERELALLYRDRRAFAVGHGCAADWPASADVAEGRASYIETAVLPQTKVYALEPLSGPEALYSMNFLAGDGGNVKPDQILAALKHLPETYRNWLSEQEHEAAQLPKQHLEAAKANLKQCADCAARIASGIALLAEHPQAMKAFMLANRAMLLQQVPALRKHALTPKEPPPNLSNERGGRWRVFQLAFLLMNIRSIVGGKHDPDGERRLVDLIWFPTGGGKTEAYLGLTAFTIFLRRITEPKKRGSVALMRYTLRLLTSQQFERAAALITACEHMRLNSRGELGEVPITIGLWAGSKLTPNYREAAVVGLREWMGGEKDSHPFQLLKCPWCGHALDDTKNPGYVRVRRGANQTVAFKCPDSRCPANKSDIPAVVVDEDIYEEPPSLVIGTVDKFAMLAWNDDSGVLLRGNPTQNIGKPDLIIQDELHLISGPLGTIVGLYEAVIDKLCHDNGAAPKVIASTATIRRADEQCRNLFDRETRLFPPSALSVRDSWFAKENTDSPGRLYVGVLGSAAPSFTTLSRQAIASLAFGIAAFELPAGLAEEGRDAYGTLIWYFNSLRELGRGSTLVDADIREHLGVIRHRLGFLGDSNLHVRPEMGRRYLRTEELTSRKRGDEIPEILQRLGLPVSSTEALDALLATNMISVGVDVPRLGLMAVAGQPKSTAEYIQATSRVGRDTRLAPGLVVTLYVPGKSRDRSHYEHFRSYHEAFYRYVEPTSVTPYSLPAIDRALHALIVILARQHAQLHSPQQLAPTAVWLRELKEWLLARAKSAGVEDRYREALKSRFNSIVSIWCSRSRPEWGTPNATKDEGDQLMYPPNADKALKDGTGATDFDVPFRTLTSMRTVDVECRLRVAQRYGKAILPGEDHGAHAAEEKG